MILPCGCSPEGEEPAVRSTRAYIDARAELRQYAESGEALTRMHALEAMGKTLGAEAGPMMVEALESESPRVQFAAAMAIGEARYPRAHDALVARAEQAGPDKRVYAGVIYALHELGDDRYTGDLIRLLHHDEPEVRANAALVMGRIGDPSAIGPLKSLMDNETSPTVKVNVHEALAILGDDRHAWLIEAYTKGYDETVRLVAIPALAQDPAPEVDLILEDLTHRRNPARVRVVAAGELGERGAADLELFNLCILSLRAPRRAWDQSTYRYASQVTEAELQSLQRLSAIALGLIGWDEAIPDLHAAMKRSSDPAVRIAAAMAILQILEDRPLGREPAAEPETAAEAAGDEEPAEEAPLPEPVPPRDSLHSSGGRD
jgi:HEAT repeat protein